MTDNNKTLADIFSEYENGETAGYFRGWGQGYGDGVMEFAKYLKENSCSYDLDNYYSFRAIDIDDLDDLVEEFLDKGEYL